MGLFGFGKKKEASNQVDTRACTECGLLNPATFTKCQTCGGKLGDKGIVVFQKDTKNNDSVIDETKSGYESQKGAELVDNHHEFEKAISHLDEAIRLNPNNVFAWNYKADALKGLGRYEECLQVIDRVIELQQSGYYPDRFSSGASIWQMKVGILETLRRFEESIECYDELIKISLEKRYLNGKADALNELGRFDEAKECFAKSKQLEEE